MVISNEDFEAALGDFLAKATDVNIKNVLGTFDKSKTVPQNIAILKDGSSSAALQDTIAFLKSNSPEYPVAQHVLSCKNRNKEEYSKDIAKFLAFVKPTQCLSCNENYIPAAEQCAGNEPKCYLCQRPSHGVCYKEIVIKPELGVIFVCSECLSVKAAKDLAAEINSKPVDSGSSVHPTGPNGKEQKAPPPDEAKLIQDQEDCPLYLKRQCPHGLTGKREINGNPCPYKHRKRCKYYIQYGPTGCRFGKTCMFLHPPLCQNSVKLKTCLNRNCEEIHIKGTQRNTRNLPEHRQQTITTSNRFPPWMAENSLTDRNQNPQSKPSSDRVSPWKFNSTTPIEEQSRLKTNSNNSNDFLERHLEEIKADLMKFIRNTITQAAPNNQPQYMMIHPANVSQQAQSQHVPLQNWTNSAINAPPAQQMESTQTNDPQLSNYHHQYPNPSQSIQRPGG